MDEGLGQVIKFYLGQSKCGERDKAQTKRTRRDLYFFNNDYCDRWKTGLIERGIPG